MYFTIDDFRQIFSDETNLSSKWPTKSRVSWRQFEYWETAMVLNIMNRFRIRVYGFMFVSFPVYYDYINLTIYLLIFYRKQKMYPWNIYSKSGQMEYEGKMERWVFGKVRVRRRSIFTSPGFLSSASSAPYIEIKLAIDHVLSISQKLNFTILINQFTHVLTSIALTN